MRSKKEEFVLELDKPGYPWQILRDEGIAWLILREKKKFDWMEIKSLGSVCLEKLNWSVKEIGRDYKLYSGSIDLCVDYQGEKMDSLAIDWQDEAEDEEYCRQVFVEGTNYKQVALLDRNFASQTSAFPSLLIDEFNFQQKVWNGTVAENSWKLSLPWRIGINGEGLPQKPQVVKIHLAQIGLSTLLLEILLKIELKGPSIAEEVCSKKYSMSSKGEAVCTIKNEQIEEVIGAVQQRGFFCGTVDHEKNELLIKNSLKTSVIFVSSKKGGERILIASCISREENAYNSVLSLQFPPAGCCHYTQSLNVVTADSEKLLLRYEHLWGIKEELGEERIIASSPFRPTEPAEANKTQPMNQQVILERKKPCDKWLKKQSRTKTKTNQSCPKMVLKIIK